MSRPGGDKEESNQYEMKHIYLSIAYFIVTTLIISRLSSKLNHMGLVFNRSKGLFSDDDLTCRSPCTVLDLMGIFRLFVARVLTSLQPPDGYFVVLVGDMIIEGALPT